MRFKRNRSVEQLETRTLLAADTGIAADLVDDAAADLTTTEVVSSLATVSGTDGSTMAEGAFDVESDVVQQWNELFGELLAEDELNQNPGYASRAMAMLNLAIYDTVSIAAGDSENTFYNYATDIVRGLSNLSTEVAASQAAYTVLSSLYSQQQGTLDVFFSEVLDSSGRGNDTAASVALGEEVGNQVLAERAGDGSEVVGEYTYTDELGYFQPDPLNPDIAAWGPAWGEVETFAISSVDSFSPETTPALTSEEYAASYNEVLELGSVDSTVRTADQTEAGIFWAYDREGLGTPLALYNDVLLTIAEQQGNTLLENAALFAQTSVAMADAAIVAWDTKFSEEFWRPVTAIHQGDADGNDLTAGDEDWTALGAPDGGEDIIGFTPQFPTYISGHATFGGALFGSLQEFYGTDDIAFELESEELAILLEDPELQAAYGLDLDDATRSFDSLSEAMAENGRSRVYLGIHFDFDDLVGQDVGQAIAASVASDFTVATDGEDSDERGGRNDAGMASNNGRDRGNTGNNGGGNRGDGMPGELDDALDTQGVSVSIDEGVMVVSLEKGAQASELIVAIDDNQVELVNARTGAVLQSQAIDDLTQVEINAPDESDSRITIDLDTESKALIGGVVVQGGESGSTIVELFTSNGPDTVLVDGNTVTVNDTAITYANVDSILWHDSGRDTLTTAADGDAEFVAVDSRQMIPQQTPGGGNIAPRVANGGQRANEPINQAFGDLGRVVFSPLGRELFEQVAEDSSRRR